MRSNPVKFVKKNGTEGETKASAYVLRLFAKTSGEILK